MAQGHIALSLETTQGQVVKILMTQGHIVKVLRWSRSSNSRLISLILSDSRLAIGDNLRLGALSFGDSGGFLP